MLVFFRHLVVLKKVGFLFGSVKYDLNIGSLPVIAVLRCLTFCDLNNTRTKTSLLADQVAKSISSGFLGDRNIKENYFLYGKRVTRIR